MRYFLRFFKQFEENKTPLLEGDKYVSIGGGGYLPKSKVENFNKGFKEIEIWFKNEIQNPEIRKAHILYELHNHEAYYVGSIEDTLEALGEDFTRNEVLAVYKENHAAYWEQQEIQPIN